MVIKKKAKNADLYDLGSFGGRLSYLAKNSYGSISGLAAKLGLPESTVRAWASGETQPRVDDLIEICTVTGTRLEWLVYARGEQATSSAVNTKPADVEAVPLNHALLTSVIQYVEEYLDSEKIEISAAKRAEIVVELYDSFKERGMDKAKVVRLIRLVARP